MKKLNLIIGLFFAVSTFVLAQESPAGHGDLKNVSCNTCHSCEVPTKTEPCLRACPREFMITEEHQPEEGPEVVVMHKLDDYSDDIYEDVKFSHRLHAEMAGMSGGCEMCHHYNPPGEILACQDCHEPQRKRADIMKPDLKGAYHRQCIDCHRTWSHEVECLSCHPPKGTENKITEKKEYTERLKEIGQAYRRVMGRHFPAMAVVIVAGLVEDEAKIEIEATAVRQTAR